jgi:hypothetical protein
MKTIKTISIIILVLIFTSYSKAWLAFNGGCKVFPNQCPNANGGDYLSNQKINIGQLITEAAGHFLQSFSDYQRILKRIELSETGLNHALDKTIQSITNANALYFEIWNTSLSLEYDPLAIEKLSQFDYNGYKLENNLNPVIFQRVEDFLKPGHIMELFQQAYFDSSQILEKLKEIKKNLESHKMVDISYYWRLNQLYFEFALFGQYASEVFVKIK